MLNKVIIFIFMVLFCSVGVCQSDARQALVEINTIKSSPDYIYAEATTSDSKTSYDNAMDLLETFIEDWIKSNCDSTEVSGCITKASKNILQIKTKRGSLYRAFLYVKKSDVLTYASDKDLVVVPLGETEKPEPNKQQTERRDSLKHEQDANSAKAPSKAYLVDDFGKKMISIRAFDGIESFVKQYSNGNMGKYKTLPKMGTYYVFVYNRSGEVMSHLRYNDGAWMNILNGNADDIKNYPGCGAIWFQKK